MLSTTMSSDYFCFARFSMHLVRRTGLPLLPPQLLVPTNSQRSGMLEVGDGWVNLMSYDLHGL